VSQRGSLCCVMDDIKFIFMVAKQWAIYITSVAGNRALSMSTMGSIIGRILLYFVALHRFLAMLSLRFNSW